MDEMNEAVEKGLEYWYQRQKQYLTEFWRRSDLDIDGDEETAVAVRYNLYQLLQSAGRDEFCNIAAKGLSGEGYEGHYFWDTEMYMQPFFTLTNPDISRKLLSFRYRTLDEARKNARIAGHESGALYPWRTIMGKECSGSVSYTHLDVYKRQQSGRSQGASQRDDQLYGTFVQLYDCRTGYLSSGGN